MSSLHIYCTPLKDNKSNYQNHNCEQIVNNPRGCAENSGNEEMPTFNHKNAAMSIFQKSFVIMHKKSGKKAPFKALNKLKRAVFLCNFTTKKDVPKEHLFQRLVLKKLVQKH